MFRWLTLPVSLRLVTGGLLFTGACTGDWSFQLPAPEGGIPQTQYAQPCSAWARAFCAYAERCQAASFEWQSLEQCAGRRALECELAAGDPDVAFDAAGLAACAYPDDCAAPPPSCWAPGKALSGAPCLRDQACRSGVCWGALATSSTCGICVCGLGCGPDQTCVADLDGGTCQPAGRAAGTACVASTTCSSGVCEPGDGGMSACAPFSGASAPCGAGLPACGPDLFCDRTAHCSPIVRVGYDASCGAYLADGSTLYICSGWATCAGTCIAPAGDGQECSPSHGIGCEWPALCLSGRCLFPTRADCSP